MRSRCKSRPKRSFPLSEFTMFEKYYVGHHGFNTFVRGVWCLNEDDETAVRVTRTGHDKDEIAVGQVLTLDEIASITEGDVYSYADRAGRYAVA